MGAVIESLAKRFARRFAPVAGSRNERLAIGAVRRELAYRHRFGVRRVEWRSFKRA